MQLFTIKPAMPVIIIPHIDPHKSGASEHVRAVMDKLRLVDPDLEIAQPVQNNYTNDANDTTLPLDITEQVKAIRRKYNGSNDRFIVVTGDYGADAARGEASVAAIFKKLLGDTRTEVILSSYTVESWAIMGAFSRGEVDRLVLPEAAIRPDVLKGISAGHLIRQNEGRIIRTASVPHEMTEAVLHEKRVQWNQAAAENKVAALPGTGAKSQKLVAIVIPGDVENRNGKPKLFTREDAVRLAEAVYVQATRDLAAGEPVTFMVSNGPRTGKYNRQKAEKQDFNAHNPDFHNPDRINGVDSNPVAKAFMDTLSALAGPEPVIDGCITKGKVPPQGFLAFYDVLNEHSAKGGKSELYIDGVSATMMAQAANVTHHEVDITALDSPAKNITHVAGLDSLFEKGHVSKLELDGQGDYQYIANPKSRREAVKFDDAALVAERLIR